MYQVRLNFFQNYPGSDITAPRLMLWPIVELSATLAYYPQRFCGYLHSYTSKNVSKPRSHAAKNAFRAFPKLVTRVVVVQCTLTTSVFHLFYSFPFNF